VIDLTDIMVARRDEAGGSGRPAPALCLAALTPEQIAAHRLVERAAPFAPPARAAHQALWRKLRAENAALRVVSPALALVSAPITAFDEALMAKVQPRWLKVARIVADTLSEAEGRPVINVGDVFLAARIRALAASGRIDVKGDPLRMRWSEVRLPS
jgi:Protein of unknown function